MASTSKRSVPVQVWLTEEERERLDAMAHDRGVPISGLIRWLLFEAWKKGQHQVEVA